MHLQLKFKYGECALQLCLFCMFQGKDEGLSGLARQGKHDRAPSERWLVSAEQAAGAVQMQWQWRDGLCA